MRPFRPCGAEKNLRARQLSWQPAEKHSRGVMIRKGASAMAKLHARPSNQYRYEHYDPRF
jgi:hypothetical protein